MSKQHLNYDETFKFWEAYPVLERREMQLRTFEYLAPFKYHNVEVERSIIAVSLSVLASHQARQQEHNVGHRDQKRQKDEGAANIGKARVNDLRKTSPWWRNPHHNEQQ